MHFILIAAKQLDFAKTRLSPMLPPAERRALAEAMFRDVLAAALGSRSADAVAVISSDRRLLETTRGAGALPIDEEFPRGLNAAVAMATAALQSRGANEICTVLSDVPMTTASDIDSVFAAMPSDGPGAILVPSHDLSGTNIICRRPPSAIATRFGRMSLLRHLDECRGAGIRAEVLRLRGPALDLDVMDDLAKFVRAAQPTHTLGHLARIGISAQ
ncbi:MAG TPA: 2-phospho-L-lactate guanylyltransferase [Candidatus Binataceae bacterium]|nr:2-phospho-L-lactate guanylyltransferase [Candidatus Binataceae bacterium]